MKLRLKFQADMYNSVKKHARSERIDIAVNILFFFFKTIELKCTLIQKK